MSDIGFLERFDLPDPVCLLKNTWSTINLWSGTTSSCHRVAGDMISESYNDFHNTPSKIEDRKKMLSGIWPDNACLYCKKIEDAGGTSDRLFANSWGEEIFNPPELHKDKNAVVLTPRFIEVYFNNVCNLSCVYCSAVHSTIWETENKIHGNIPELDHYNTTQSKELYEKRVDQHWKWLKDNVKTLSHYNILGGEPFYQEEFEKNVDFFLENPNEHLHFAIFSNLKVNSTKMRKILDKIALGIETKAIKSFRIFCSLDCWGKEQEYTRTGLCLKNWEENFNIILNEYPQIRLEIHSTIVSMGLKTLPELCQKVTEWNNIREVKHSLSLADGRQSMHPGIWNNSLFESYWQSAIDNTKSQVTKNKILSLKKMCENQEEDVDLQNELRSILSQLDIRRNTDWKKTFDWLK